MKSIKYKRQHDNLKIEVIEEIKSYARNVGGFLIGSNLQIHETRYNYCKKESVKVMRGYLIEQNSRGIVLLLPSTRLNEQYRELFMEYSQITLENLVIILEFIERFWRGMGIDYYDRRYPVSFQHPPVTDSFREDVSGVWIEDVQYFHSDELKTYFRKDLGYGE